MSDTLTLYGVKVPAHEYGTIKQVADILIGKTDVAVPLATARRQCVAITRDALKRAAEVTV